MTDIKRPFLSAILSLVALSCSFLGTAPGLRAQESIDEAAIEILRREGLEQSQVKELLSWICDVHGPRLTGSQNLVNAQAWAGETMREWGAQNVHLEEWGPFGSGWSLQRFSMHVVGDNPWPVIASPKAWSPGVEGRVRGKVVRADLLTQDELRAMDLSEAIVFLEEPRDAFEPFNGPATRFNDPQLLAKANSMPDPTVDPVAAARAQRDRASFRRRGEVLRVLYENRPLLIVDRYFKGQYGTVFATSASMPPVDGQRQRPWQEGADVVPQVTMAVEQYNRVCRLIEKGQDIELEFELETTFDASDPMERNLLAEIPGTDPDIGSQVVMLGAHFDSWHTGTGATDNGSGSAVMMEAFRLLHVLQCELGRGPRRTIRLALWSGEEQGLLGSRGYVKEHFGTGATEEEPAVLLPEHETLSGYFNLDNGTGQIRGVYLQGRESMRPIFGSWLRPFHDLGAHTLTLDDTGGTDHLAFDRVGLPGFQFIQDPVAYSTQTHHSNMDVWDHAIGDDLKQAATVIAAFVWHTAERDEMLPRD
ncbi:MAG: M28 family peptidase [Planctomycetota bacterium]